MKHERSKNSGNDRFLEQLRIASPCTASFEGMVGDERVRHCSDCKLSVYNLSGMSRRQAVDLLRHNEGGLCIRMLRRPDGTVITRDCPIGLRALRRNVARGGLRCAALVGCLLAGLMGCTRQEWKQGLQRIFPIGKPVQAQPLMGEVCVPQIQPVPRGARLLGRIARPQK